ncbi:SDR family NAD(P)-dependent oxidoreductase [Chloroflexota bacterium]
MEVSRFALTDKVAIVTGGGRGIGKGIALSFAKAGANLVIAEIDAPEAEVSAEEIRALGRKALAVPTDARSSQQVENMLQKALNKFGRIDILVNNVGGSLALRFPILDMSEDEWDMIITLNLKSVFLCSKAVAKVMIDQKRGNIINIASVGGLGPYPNNAHYGAAKAGVINLTQSMAWEWAPYNIRVNAIAPGGTATRVLDKLYGERPDLLQERLKLIPLQRLGKPEDIGDAAIYLASDASDYVTGETIMVTGGTIGGLLLPVRSYRA